MGHFYRWFGLGYAILSAACGGPELGAGVESAQLGSLEQPIWAPSGYGQENGSGGPRCILPYNEGICKMPKKRAIWYAISPHVQCSNAYWNVKIREAFAKFNTWLDGTSFSFVEKSTFEVATGDGWLIECSALFNPPCGPNGCPMGAAHPRGWECHGPSGAEVCQVSDGTLYLYGQNLANLVHEIHDMGYGTAEEKNFIFNILVHEYGHIVGLGHSPLGVGQPLMSEGFDPNDMIHEKRYPTSYEHAMIDAYCPNGNTQNCP